MSSATHAIANRSKPAQAPTRPQNASASFGGQALPPHTQAQMSARFGHDFSSVRVHTDHRAGDTAEALGANAFTLDRDIVFNEGQYTPGSPQTERLLAHELTHVVQQDRWGGPGSDGPLSRRGDASEREASSLADRVTGGESVDVKAAPGAMVARDEDELGARAYTAGQDISFGAGSYAPGGGGGDRLLAHELSHVVQQGGASLGPPSGPPAGGGVSAGINQSVDQMEMISNMLKSENDMSKSIINNLK